MPTTESLLLDQYSSLVRRLAQQLAARLPANVELDDLIQAGMAGLLDAARRYEHRPDAQFETYAVTRIRGAMLDELRAMDWLPRSVRGKARVIEHAVAALNQKLLRAASEAEIANELGMELADYRQLLDDARGIQVLHGEDMATYGDDTTAASLLSGEAVQTAQWRSDPLTQLLFQNMREAIIEAIEALPKRERQLLSLLIEQELTQKEIAVVMEISEGRVSQLRTQAIVRIRARLAAQAMEEGWKTLALPDFY